MKMKSMVLIMIALVCGLIASIGISQVMEQGKEPRDAAPTEPIFVALSHIDIGDALDSSNVKLEEWQRDRIPGGAIQNLEQLEARFARQRLYPGEPILDVKLMDSTAGDTSSKIPEGYRVCSIKVTMDTSVSNLIKPGDRVDLIAFFRKSNEIGTTGARTILRDVRVFAINHETERTVDNDGQVTSAKTVSLLAKPHQVEMVTLAGHLGKLQLSLRRPDDKSIEDYGQITVDGLLNSQNEVADDPEEPSSAQLAGSGVSESQDFLEMLQRDNSPTNVAAAQPPPPTASDEPQGPAEQPLPFTHTMVVYSPGGATQYQWQDETKLPQQGAPDTSTLHSSGPIHSPTAVPRLQSPPTSGRDTSPSAAADQVEFSELRGNDSRNGIDSAELTEGSQFDDASQSE